MRNYITLNGKNSNEINGLLIQELPPISKPQIRTEVEEIDGRDGDIVTKLGFAAYDKEFTVGLYKDFDINAIVAYFNSEGTVIFSNEPDKYYNYQIIDQIDFERLVRYRTATVRMHTQPFKYSNTESARTLGNKGTVSGEGSNIVLENTAEAPFNVLRHKGNAIQDGTPTPSAPVPIQTVTGRQTVTVTGKNLFNPTATPWGSKVAYNGSGTQVWWDGYYGIIKYQPVQPNTQYTFSNSTGKPIHYGIVFYDANKAKLSNIFNDTTTFTTPANCAYIRFAIQNDTAPTWAQLELGNQATAYEPYRAQEYEINLGKNLIDYMSATYDSNGGAVSAVKGSDSITFTKTWSNRYAYSIMKLSLADSRNLYGKTVTVSYNKSATIANIDSGIRCFWGTETGTTIGDQLFANLTQTTGAQSVTFNVPATPPASDKPVLSFLFYPDNTNEAIASSSVLTISDFQIELGDQATDYSAYFEPIELAAIGDYADEPVKVGDTWYIRRAVGKVVLNGSETISRGGTTANQYFYANVLSNYVKPSNNNQLIPHFSNRFTSKTPNQLSGGSVVGSTIRTDNAVGFAFGVSSEINTVDKCKTWLASNNVTVYYPLATSTTTEITNEALIAQLEALYNQAHAYKGRTHVAAIAQGSNAPHIIEAEVQRSSDGNITNNGNIVSKPTLTIYGSGNIGVSLNGYQIFEITLGDEEYITIDTAAMEAYKDTPDNLKNRLVNGDYSKFALSPGSNMVEFSGTVSKCVISKYSRWL